MMCSEAATDVIPATSDNYFCSDKPGGGQYEDMMSGGLLIAVRRSPIGSQAPSRATIWARDLQAQSRAQAPARDNTLCWYFAFNLRLFYVLHQMTYNNHSTYLPLKGDPVQKHRIV